MRATSVSLVLLGAIAVGQDRRPAETTVSVPAGKAPVMDGRLDEEEWRGAATFEVQSGSGVLGKGRMQRVGRELYIGFSCDIPAVVVGLRFNFDDPATGRVIPVLVTPVNPPRAPLAAFRRTRDGDVAPVSCERCNVRFEFSKQGGFSLELRLSMDALQFARSSRHYGFTVEIWDLPERRPIGVFPVSAAAASGRRPARLVPSEDWGAKAGDVRSPVQPALKLLEEIGADANGPGKLIAATGWADGRRKDATLADIQKRLIAAVKAYPDYASVHAQLVQANAARNDAEAALAALDVFGAAFPAVAASPRHVMMRAESLRDLGRFDEALRYLDEHAEMLKGTLPLARRRQIIVGLMNEWKQEEELRRLDAQRDDLPRVKLKTNKGEIVIELFEDDAPNGVANFISLAESGAYRGTRFFWSEGGRRVLGGGPNTKDEDPENDGTGDPGYLIESDPGRRLNFAYAVAFADKRSQRRTEGASFVIHLAPFPGINGSNTVFGRVIEGADVVRKLEYYDVIEDAVVVRKRDHPYVPVKR